MYRNKLSHIDSDWERRSIFHKKKRFRGWLWLLTLLPLAVFAALAWQEIPSLLLGSFKLIAHWMPDQSGLIH